MKSIRTLAAAAAFSLAILPAFAGETVDHSKMDHGQTDHGQSDHGGPTDLGQMDHAAMDHGAMSAGKAGDSASTKAFRAADKAMMEGMAIEYSNDADVDFMRAMIPHHEGAVAMAEIELKYGKDPEARKLAEAILKAQKEEIAFMKAWLAKNAQPSKNGQ